MAVEYTPNWIKEDRTPSFPSEGSLSDLVEHKFLWGNMPAVDILNTQQNEGVNKTRPDISLLFAASGDIRSIVKTVVEGLPDGYGSQCKVVINDHDFMVVARNAILLPTALSLQTDDAVMVMIHVWYSALLPQVMMNTLGKVVLVRVLEVCEKIKHKPTDSLQAKTFHFGKRSLRLVLKKYQWDELRDCFSVPSGLTQQDAQAIRRRRMLAPERTDALNREMYLQYPSFRVATMTFREDGILMPHGASREHFDTPNP